MSAEKNILETFVEHQNDVDTILNVPGTDTPLLILHNGDKQAVDLEKYLNQPLKLRTTKEFRDIRGFIDYVNDFKGEHTVIFAGSEQITAIFDYHKKDDPRWCNHIATFKLSISNRWKIWTGAHNEWMPQKRFADFLDSGLNEIIVSIINGKSTPSQAEVLSIVKNFRTTQTYEYDSSIDEGSETIGFKKIIQGGSSKTEKLVLPEYVMIALQPYEDIHVINDRLSEDLQLPAYELKVKLSWMVQTEGERGVLGFKIQILNVENVLNKTLEKIKNAVANLTEVKTYIG
ncbi:MAG: YfdQ family protein [Burkholderiales bacterium]|nr:YfdQ family protein [Burkholderiales bacterium]